MNENQQIVENKIKLLAIGGMSDHIHLLISMPSTLSIAKAMQLLKGSSSKWIHETFPEYSSFEWQRDYGAFRLVLQIYKEQLIT